LSFDPSPLDNHHLLAQGEKLNAAILSDFAAEFQWEVQGAVSCISSFQPSLAVSISNRRPPCKSFIGDAEQFEAAQRDKEPWILLENIALCANGKP
jgi:hypothetical protein